MSSNMRKKYYDDDGNEKPSNPTAGDGEAEEVEEEERTMYEFVVGQLDKFFVDHIPVESLKELPSVYMYYGGVVAYLSAFALFAYFVATSYIAAMEQSYIATDKSSGQCETVSISVTGNYLADKDGNWVGSPAFSYSGAKYDISFNNFQVNSYSQYIQMMDTFQSALLDMGAKANLRNLPYNLIVWMSYIKFYSVADPLSTNFTSIGKGQLQYIQMTGNAQQVFDLSSQIVSLGSVQGACPQHSLTDFDKSNAIIQTILDFDSYTNDTLCMDALPPTQYGYAAAVDDGQFTIELNVETFSLAMAINLGILSVEDLSLASNALMPLVIHNTLYYLGEYFDNRNFEMDPMYCMYNATAIPAGQPNIQQLCMYVKSRFVALPTFNHFGEFNSVPKYCECGVNGASTGCNTFNLMATFVFFPIANSTSTSSPVEAIQSQIMSLLQLLSKYDGDYSKFNEASYNATWSVAGRIFDRQAPYFTSEAWYNQSFEFCQLSSGDTCSLLVFNSFDVNACIVSDYKYSLLNGSCSDSISIPAADWNKLEAAAPVQLTQDYYKCYPTEFSAFFNALGIASGNTALAVPLIVVVLLPMMYIVLVFMQQLPPKEEYTPLEKEQAVDILALILLRLRDGKTRGIRKGGVLQQLTKELVAAAKEEGGFPDSDDEEEEEDDLGKKKASVRIKIITPGKGGAAFDEDDDPPPPDSDDEDSDGDDRRARGKDGARKPRRRSSAMKQAGEGGEEGGDRGEGGVRRRKKAGRLGVFVKHLEESEQPASKPTPASAPAQDHSSFPVFNYLFGGGGSGAGERSSMAGGLELESYRPSQVNPLIRVVDLTKERMPKDVRVLNMPEGEVLKEGKKIKPERLDTLVSDLLARFAEALSVRGGDARRSASYAEGCAIARQLVNVDYEAFLAHENVVLFLKLSNALCMHASIELECEMRELETKYANRIAYNVGNHVLTAATMSAMLA